ncbi:hypothetical protein Gpo141_00012384 [Globisporangium polare]
MKLYVHYEDHAGLGTSSPPRVWTKRVTLTPALETLDDVLRVFCAAHARRFTKSGGKETATLVPADLDVFTERDQESATRRHLVDDRRAQKWIAQQRRWATGERDGDECDFELIVVRKAVTAKKAHKDSGSSPAAGGCVAGSAPDVKLQQVRAITAQQKGDKETQPHKQQQQLKPCVELGVSQMQQLKYRSAKQLFETLVLSVDPTNVQALVAMGDIHFSNQRFGVAVSDWYKKCWDAHSGKLSQEKAHLKAVFECGLKIVRCEIQCKKYCEALQMIDKLQELLRREARSSKSNSAGAFVAASASIAGEKEEMEAKMDLLKAQTIHEMHTRSPELQEPAIALLVHLLPDLQDPHVNLDALLLYARIAFERGKKSEALTMVLRVLVARSDDKLVKQQLASFLTSKSDMKLLQQVLPAEGGASSAAAYAFIGTILKDFGELESSVTCFEQAQVGNPACPSYALNHGHVLEVCNRYETAYNVLTAFFRRNPTLSVGGVLTAGAVLEALDTGGWLPPASDEKEQGGHVNEKETDEREQWRVEWIMKDTGHARVYLNNTLVSNPKGGSSKPSLLPEQEQLDLLACFFTVVKILFLTGRVSGLPRLISLIEPVRAGKELHRTAVRNEQAYYSCIAQLLSVDDRSSASGLHRRPLSEAAPTDVYVCGDSHTLATAWREIQVQGQRTLLRPALVTGLKHWHLRKESTFYPKLHFWRVLESIPRRAKVVFLFGEIDCREGILLAVEKCKYESIEEGMEVTIRIFMEALSEAVRKFEFEALIHPVVPVLNETRQLVIQYNQIFREYVSRSKICSWLNFFDDLVHDSPEKLRPEFALDGTHLHPRYLSSLERALNQSVK